MRKTLLMSTILCAVSVFPLTAQAEGFSPSVSGSVLFELEDDWTFDSDDEDTEVNTLYTTIEPSINIGFTENLSLETAFVFEPVQGTDAGDDTEFENEGLYAEQIKLVYGTDSWSVYGGKFNPNFGTAWDVTPGVYGVDFAEDYELAEKIGFGGNYTLSNEKAGSYTLSANTFFADTSFLSGATITGRDELDESDGGVSNTEDFSSFSVALDGEKTAGIENLNTHLGYYSQAEGDADIGLDSETGYAVGANYTIPVTEKVEVLIVGEWAGIRDSGGTTHDDVDYLTGGLGLTYDQHWNAALSHTSRDTDVDGGADVEDHMTQLSAGYAFDNGVSLDVGYRNSEESDEDTNILGAVAAYTLEF